MKVALPIEKKRRLFDGNFFSNYRKKNTLPKVQSVKLEVYFSYRQNTVRMLLKGENSGMRL